MTWISGAMLCLAIAIAASGVAFTSIAPSAAPVARWVFWIAAVACAAMIVMATVSGVRRQRDRKKQSTPQAASLNR